MQNYQTSCPIPENMMMQPQRVIKSQCCGMVIAGFFCLFGVLAIFGYTFNFFISNTTLEYVQHLCNIISWAVFTYFIGRITFDKQYCSGKPALTKIWPIAVIYPFSIVANIIEACIKEPYYNEILEKTVYPVTNCFVNIFISLPLMFSCLWAMYFGDDEGTSCCLFFKPWRLVADPTVMAMPSNYPNPQAQNHVYPYGQPFQAFSQGEPPVYPIQTFPQRPVK